MNPTSPPATPSHPEQAERSAAQRKAMALQRIDASRTQLIICLLPKEPQQPATAAEQAAEAADNGLHSVQRFSTSLMKRIERNGLVNGAWRTARTWSRRWWTRQPWHAPAELVITTLAHETRPIIRRHPWAALAAGAAVGALLMGARPLLSNTLRRSALPVRNHLGGLLWTQLAQAPVQLALAGALTAWITKHATPPAQPAAQTPASPTMPDTTTTSETATETAAATP